MRSILAFDYPAIQGVVLVVAFVSLMIYLALDIVHAFLDPRIKVLGMQPNATVPEKSTSTSMPQCCTHAAASRFRERLRKDKLFLVGCIIVALSLFLAAFGPHRAL